MIKSSLTERIFYMKHIFSIFCTFLLAHTLPAFAATNEFIFEISGEFTGYKGTRPNVRTSIAPSDCAPINGNGVTGKKFTKSYRCPNNVTTIAVSFNTNDKNYKIKKTTHELSINSTTKKYNLNSPIEFEPVSTTKDITFTVNGNVTGHNGQFPSGVSLNIVSPSECKTLHDSAINQTLSANYSITYICPPGTNTVNFKVESKQPAGLPQYKVTNPDHTITLGNKQKYILPEIKLEQIKNVKARNAIDITQKATTTPIAEEKLNLAKAGHKTTITSDFSLLKGFENHPASKYCNSDNGRVFFARQSTETHSLSCASGRKDGINQEELNSALAEYCKKLLDQVAKKRENASSNQTTTDNTNTQNASSGLTLNDTQSDTSLLLSPSNDKEPENTKPENMDKVLNNMDRELGVQPRTNTNATSTEPETSETTETIGNCGEQSCTPEKEDFLGQTDGATDAICVNGTWKITQCESGLNGSNKQQCKLNDKTIEFFDACTGTKTCSKITKQWLKRNNAKSAECDKTMGENYITECEDGFTGTARPTTGYSKCEKTLSEQEAKEKEWCETKGSKGTWNVKKAECDCKTKNHFMDGENGCVAGTPDFNDAQEKLNTLKSQLDETIKQINNSNQS